MRPRDESKVGVPSQAFRRLADKLLPDEMEFVVTQIETAIERDDKLRGRAAGRLAESGVGYAGRRERVATETSALLRSFRHRRELLSDSLGAAQVAELFGTSRQTPHDRVRSGTLLAVLDSGMWRFPACQFDPAGPGGVIAGFPEVLRALTTSSFAKLSWLVTPNPVFRGATPLDVLKRGDVQRVVSAARAVEAD